MGARRVAAALCFVALEVPWLRASDLEVETARSGALPAAPAMEASALQPWIHASMRPVLEAKVEAAFAIAADRLRDRPECRELFSRLGSDGLEMLRQALYFPMPATFDGRSICGRAHAATVVGTHSTFVCRRLQWLSDEHAAMVLIHEALHHAGLTELPQDPEGLRSSEITRMVKSSCGS